MSAADDYKKRMEAIMNEGCRELAQQEQAKLKQVGGSHYQVAAIQPWDIFAAYGLDPWSANVVKYILRFPYKAGRQDLEKAQHYIEYLITHYDEVKDTYYD
jgi:hypothetical protein